MSVMSLRMTRLRAIVDSLRSTECPACHKQKQPSQSFCRQCFARLRIDSRGALYHGFGQGYEEAMEQAMRELGKADEAWLSIKCPTDCAQCQGVIDNCGRGCPFAKESTSG